MVVFARVLSGSILAAALGVSIGFVLFGSVPDSRLPCFILGCLGAVVGALAGTAQEIATALRRKTSN